MVRGTWQEVGVSAILLNSSRCIIPLLLLPFSKYLFMMSFRCKEQFFIADFFPSQVHFERDEFSLALI